MRGGAALSPILAGVLFAEKLSLPVVSAIMAIGSLLALILITTLPADKRRGA